MVNGDSSRLSDDTPASEDEKVSTESARPRKKKQSLFAQKKAQLLKAKQGGQSQETSTLEVVEQSQTTAEYFPKATVVYQPLLPEEKKKSASYARNVAGSMQSMGQVGMGDDAIDQENMSKIQDMSAEEILEA